MIKQYYDEQYYDAAVIDASTREFFSKEDLLDLLKMHHVETASVEDSSISLEDTLPTLKKAKINLPEAFFKDLACKIGLPFLDYNRVTEIYREEQKSKLVSILPYPIISKYKIIPLQINGKIIDLAIDNPLDRRVLGVAQYLFSSYNIHLRVVSAKSIEWAIDKIYREIHKKNALLDLYNRTPDQSAHAVLYRNQKIFLLVLLVAFTVLVVVNFAVTLAVLVAAITVLYFVVNPVKIYISLLGFRGTRSPTKITRGELLLTRDEDLPVYTVLVPVYREASVLAQNMKNMHNLNYPKNKLDIKILMEESDQETINEAKRLGLFGSPQKMVEGIPPEKYTEFLALFDPLIIPAAKVTTKPRACNYGLLRAKGELCVIYDAEDKPDPDQLKKAALVFKRSTSDVVCLQSKLNFYNANENLLTKWFSIEYANWFEFYLQGLDWIDAPIPLGGTSNHFRKKALDELGRWDPYNVTEDADLGVRLARQKMKTEIIDTYTYEEATLSVKCWVKQRARWYKGHLQTYLVHMRHPRKLWADLGTSKFFKLQMTFGTSVVVSLMNPILWGLTALALVLPIFLPLSFEWLVPSYLWPLGLVNLLVGNLSYLSIYVVSCLKLKKRTYVPLALLMPLYWVLHSMASWKGLIQLIRNPHYWDKTSHGVTKVAKEA